MKGEERERMSPPAADQLQAAKQAADEYQKSVAALATAIRSHAHEVEVTRIAGAHRAMMPVETWRKIEGLIEAVDKAGAKMIRACPF